MEKEVEVIVVMTMVIVIVVVEKVVVGTDGKEERAQNPPRAVVFNTGQRTRSPKMKSKHRGETQQEETQWVRGPRSKRGNCEIRSSRRGGHRIRERGHHGDPDKGSFSGSGVEVILGGRGVEGETAASDGHLETPGCEGGQRNEREVKWRAWCPGCTSSGWKVQEGVLLCQEEPSCGEAEAKRTGKGCRVGQQVSCKDERVGRECGHLSRDGGRQGCANLHLGFRILPVLGTDLQPASSSLASLPHLAAFCFLQSQACIPGVPSLAPQEDCLPFPENSTQSGPLQLSSPSKAAWQSSSHFLALLQHPFLLTAFLTPARRQLPCVLQAAWLGHASMVAFISQLSPCGQGWPLIESPVLTAVAVFPAGPCGDQVCNPPCYTGTG
ncbi:PREDICTED: uncharacterized protein LOC106148121 [Chinchilla lanigera]|uniref:uncharacterized protein LOC106148121 n=1 Tax=Chinchilla lanigera TaxID=34839 RepID=UPI000696BFB2|nr:PREDICTED: uncharacterized protein LOC106148121 [Chinchilla lanigera]